jgi:hypothetical protein
MKKLSEYLTHHSNKQISLIYKLASIWPNIVGNSNAKQCLPVKLKNKELKVVVFDNIYIQGLNFIKEDIIEKLQQLDFDINNIRFVFRAYNNPYSPEKKFKEITEKERKFIERYANMVKNEKVREAYKTALTSYFKVYSLNDFFSVEKEGK